MPRSPFPPSAFKPYQARPGDTLGELARATLVPDASEEDIRKRIALMAEANALEDPDRIEEGQTLQVPRTLDRFRVEEIIGQRPPRAPRPSPTASPRPPPPFSQPSTAAIPARMEGAPGADEFVGPPLPAGFDPQMSYMRQEGEPSEGLLGRAAQAAQFALERSPLGAPINAVKGLFNDADSIAKFASGAVDAGRHLYDKAGQTFGVLSGDEDASRAEVRRLQALAGVSPTADAPGDPLAALKDATRFGVAGGAALSGFTGAAMAPGAVGRGMGAIGGAGAVGLNPDASRQDILLGGLLGAGATAGFQGLTGGLTPKAAPEPRLPARTAPPPPATPAEEGAWRMGVEVPRDRIGPPAQPLTPEVLPPEPYLEDTFVRQTIDVAPSARVAGAGLGSQPPRAAAGALPPGPRAPPSLGPGVSSPAGPRAPSPHPIRGPFMDEIVSTRDGGMRIVRPGERRGWNEDVVLDFLPEGEAERLLGGPGRVAMDEVERAGQQRLPFRPPTPAPRPIPQSAIGMRPPAVPGSAISPPPRAIPESAIGQIRDPNAPPDLARLAADVERDAIWRSRNSGDPSVLDGITRHTNEFLADPRNQSTLDEMAAIFDDLDMPAAPPRVPSSAFGQRPEAAPRMSSSLARRFETPPPVERSATIPGYDDGSIFKIKEPPGWWRGSREEWIEKELLRRDAMHEDFRSPEHQAYVKAKFDRLDRAEEAGVESDILDALVFGQLPDNVDFATRIPRAPEPTRLPFPTAPRSPTVPPANDWFSPRSEGSIAKLIENRPVYPGGRSPSGPREPMNIAELPEFGSLGDDLVTGLDRPAGVRPPTPVRPQTPSLDRPPSGISDIVPPRMSSSSVGRADTLGPVNPRDGLSPTDFAADVGARSADDIAADAARYLKEPIPRIPTNNQRPPPLAPSARPPVSAPPAASPGQVDPNLLQGIDRAPPGLRDDLLRLAHKHPRLANLYLALLGLIPVSATLAGVLGGGEDGPAAAEPYALPPAAPPRPPVAVPRPTATSTTTPRRAR